MIKRIKIYGSSGSGGGGGSCDAYYLEITCDNCGCKAEYPNKNWQSTRDSYEKDICPLCIGGK